MNVMNHNANKERWIEEVLGSTQGASRAQPAAGLYERVAAGLHTHPATAAVPVRQWAAAAVILLGLNIGSVIWFTKQNNQVTVADTSNPLSTELNTASVYNY